MSIVVAKGKLLAADGISVAGETIHSVSAKKFVHLGDCTTIAACGPLGAAEKAADLAEPFQAEGPKAMIRAISAGPWGDSNFEVLLIHPDGWWGTTGVGGYYAITPGSFWAMGSGANIALALVTADPQLTAQEIVEMCCRIVTTCGGDVTSYYIPFSYDNPWQVEAK